MQLSPKVWLHLVSMGKCESSTNPVVYASLQMGHSSSGARVEESGFRLSMRPVRQAIAQDLEDVLFR